MPTFRQYEDCYNEAEDFFKIQFDPDDDGDIVIHHRGIEYGYIVVDPTRKVVLWQSNGNSMNLQLISQVVDKMNQLNKGFK